MTSQPPVETLTELKLPEALKQAVKQAYIPDDNPLLMAYVDKQGRPGLSYRGSAVVFSDTQLGMWARNGEGGTASALDNNANVTLIYRQPSPDHGRSQAVVTFRGRARVDNNAASRSKVYEDMPQRERDADPDMKGVAIIIDLESVDGFMPGYRFQMRG